MTHPTDFLFNTDRRDFLKRAAGTGVVMGVGPLLAGCLGSGDDGSAAAPASNTRSFAFDLRGADPSAEHFLVAGNRHHALLPATPERIAALKLSDPSFQDVSGQNITHIGEALPMPDQLQMCFVKSRPRPGAREAGTWNMHTMFYHVPATATALAAQQIKQSCAGKPPASLRGAFQECVRATLGAAPLGDPPAASANCTNPDYDAYKDYFDHAVALVCNHPEIGSFDGPTLSYVQQSIVCADPNVLQLAVSLFQQGPASTTPGGWATLVPYADGTDANGNTIYRTASNGDKLYFSQHSQATLQLTGVAINSVLPKVKNDPLLGADITGMNPADLNTALQGKMWVTRNGFTAPPVSASPQAARALGAPKDLSAVAWAALDLSSGNGCHINSVVGDANRTVSFNISNWYLRYLGLYVRYLDGAGNPIRRTDLPAATQQQFIGSASGTFDCFLSIVNQELVLLGIPVKQSSQQFSITVPPNAATVLLIAGGLGHGTNSYPDTIKAGAIMTVVLDLAIPGLFLALSAASGYASYCGKLAASTGLLIGAAEIILKAVSDIALTSAYNDPSVFINLILPIASSLVKGATALWAITEESIAEGEAEGVAEDAIPFGFGLIIQAVMALGTAAQIAETSAEVARSPWQFVTQVRATHDLKVTVKPDPTDTAGFPATATHYTLLAVCDGGTPVSSGRIDLPPTTTTTPVSFTFPGLPSGGKVTVTASFFSANGWLAGAGSTGPVDNTLDEATLTIKEFLVPLDATTLYSHKQKTTLNSAGARVWRAGAAPPRQLASCNNVPGNLCVLQGITVSETFGAVGYAWQSYSAGVTSFSNGAPGQLYQFANISFTESPQSGYLHSRGGFPAPARLAYERSGPVSRNFYIDTSGGRQVVRRINMVAVGQPPVLDAPGSDRAVGVFNFSSDAFLIHPSGKLISINSALSRLEVLTPSDVPVADANAPLAQSFSGPGTRQGLLNGPVCAAMTSDGVILVLEQAANRIQAFDTGANPLPRFGSSSLMPLKPQSGKVVYLDMAVEHEGFIYVLSRNEDANVTSLDIYKKTGEWVAVTRNMEVAKLAIDLFRNVYTLNYETLQPVGALTEPSVSEWIPSTPPGPGGRSRRLS